MGTARRHAAVIDDLEQFALTLPGAWADSPWGDRVVKVGRKIFVFLGSHESDDPGFSVKLPESAPHALSYERAAPTRYGLGAHGWVSIAIGGVPQEDIDVLFDFVEESYRAVAAKSLIKQLDALIAARTGDAG